MLKTIKILFSFFLLLSAPFSLLAEKKCVCGTITRDYEYRNAIVAFDTALRASGFHFANGYFPRGIFDACGNKIFAVEGKIYWDSEKKIVESRTDGVPSIEVSRSVHRYAEWTDLLDEDLRNFCSKSAEERKIINNNNRFEHTEEDEFEFHKDYTVFPRVFTALRKDIMLDGQRRLDFYHRRLAEFKRNEGIDYFTLNELKDDLKGSEKQFKKVVKIIDDQQEIAFANSKSSLDYCLKHHDRPKAHFERGVFCFLEGNALDALEHVYKAINLGKDLDSLGEDAALLKAQMESELGLYAEAVESLTNLIQKDPTNKMAYYERASAYFEVGDFDLALTDYLSSEFKPIAPSEMVGDTALFAIGMLTGAVKGGTEAADEFIPSMLSTIYGLGGALWTSVAHPIDHTVLAIQVSKDLALAAYSCAEYLAETPISQIKDAIGETIVLEIQKLIENWKDLSIQERGDQTGFLLGKFGVNIFAADKTVKGVKLLSDLTKANRLLTFEAATLTEQNRLVILAKANEAAAKRTEALTVKSLKIKTDLQGKHITGHNSYDNTRNRSIFEHPNPQELVIKHAGTGFGEKGVIGEAGYIEVVNFGEFIGYDVNIQTGVQTPTSWGKIHYAKDGTHIVPTQPRELSILNKQKK